MSVLILGIKKLDFTSKMLQIEHMGGRTDFFPERTWNEYNDCMTEMTMSKSIDDDGKPMKAVYGQWN